MEFKKPEVEDLPILKSFFEQDPMKFTACGYTAAMFYLWAPPYHGEYAIVENTLIQRCLEDDGTVSYAFPIGSGDKKAALDRIISLCKEDHVPFLMHDITREVAYEMQKMYGDVFEVEYDRDNADYVYLTEKMVSLSGKKLHGKRNHINRFNADHEWSYEEINGENELDCLAMLMQWKIDNPREDEDVDTKLKEEVSMTTNAIMYRRQLGLVGGLIRCEGKIVAISLGEPLSDEMFVVHIEKAFSDINGAYPIINQQFALHAASEYKYLNREEDCGVDGLRQAKLSYKPEKLIERGLLKFKEDTLA